MFFCAVDETDRDFESKTTADVGRSGVQISSRDVTALHRNKLVFTMREHVAALSLQNLWWQHVHAVSEAGTSTSAVEITGMMKSRPHHPPGSPPRSPRGGRPRKDSGDNWSITEAARKAATAWRARTKAAGDIIASTMQDFEATEKKG